jgi:hypothetical protein
MMITAWSKVVPDGGVAFANLARFAAARMPKLIVKRRMEKERILAAPLFDRFKTLAFHSLTSDEIFQRQVHNVLGAITCEHLLGILIQMNAF